MVSFLSNHVSKWNLIATLVPTNVLTWTKTPFSKRDTRRLMVSRGLETGTGDPTRPPFEKQFVTCNSDHYVNSIALAN